MLIWLLLGCSLTLDGSTGKYEFVNAWWAVEETPAILSKYEGTCGRFREDGIFQAISGKDSIAQEYCIDAELLIYVEDVTLEVTSSNGCEWDISAHWNGLSGDGLLVPCELENEFEYLTLEEAFPLVECEQ